MPALARLRLPCSALLAAAFLAGCGGGAGAGEGTRAGGAPETRAVERPPPQARAEGRRAGAGGACQDRLGSFVASMDSLRRRLAVGLTFDQYLAEVRGIRSTYRKIAVGRVQIDCLSAVGTPAEKAFNRYIEAAGDWGRCVSEAGCTSAAVEPVLQRRWRIASHLLSEADAGLSASAP